MSGNRFAGVGRYSVGGRERQRASGLTQFPAGSAKETLLKDKTLLSGRMQRERERERRDRERERGDEVGNGREREDSPISLARLDEKERPLDCSCVRGEHTLLIKDPGRVKHRKNRERQRDAGGGTTKEGEKPQEVEVYLLMTMAFSIGPIVPATLLLSLGTRQSFCRSCKEPLHLLLLLLFLFIPPPVYGGREIGEGQRPFDFLVDRPLLLSSSDGQQRMGRNGGRFGTDFAQLDKLQSTDDYQSRKRSL